MQYGFQSPANPLLEFELCKREQRKCLLVFAISLSVESVYNKFIMQFSAEIKGIVSIIKGFQNLERLWVGWVFTYPNC